MPTLYPPETRVVTSIAVEVLGFMLMFVLVAVGLAFCAAGCAPAVANTPAPKAAPVVVQQNRAFADPSCVQPPESLYGAQKAAEVIDKDTGDRCVGYGIGIMSGAEHYVCGYRLCQQECNGEFRIDLAMCLPAKQLRKMAEDESDEDAGRVKL